MPTAGAGAGHPRDAPEKGVDGRAMRALHALGFHVTRLQQSRASRQTAGVPDLYAMHPSWRLALWVELKAPGGGLSDAQRAWHAAAARAGVPVCVFREVGDLVALLQALGAPI